MLKNFVKFLDVDSYIYLQLAIMNKAMALLYFLLSNENGLNYHKGKYKENIDKLDTIKEKVGISKAQAQICVKFLQKHSTAQISRRSNPFQPHLLKTRPTMPIKLVLFDIDGTILQTYSWQHIHQNLGTWNQAKEYYNQFFRNQITYEEWAKLDAKLWKNQPITKINEIISQMPYTKGAKETLFTLKEKSIRTYLLSAGLTQVAEKINEEIGVNGYAANTILTKDGYLTGNVEVNVSFHNKDKHLPNILQKFNLTLNECAAVGDDPTLIPIFKKVALAIAFNPTNKTVEEHANIIVRSDDLRNILPYIFKEN